MAHRVLIINGKQPNAGVGGVSDADFSHHTVRYFTAGVVGAGDYLVEAQDTPDMTVSVAPGEAYVPNSAGTMLYPTELDTGTNVTIDPNVAGNDRIDAIVIVIDTEADPNEFADDIITVEAVQGSAAASPVAPTDNEIQTALGAGKAWLRLANVTVENGTSSITNADISDVRTTATRKPVPSNLVADADGSTITFDLAEGSIHSVTLGGNRTLAISNARPGLAFILRLKQDATGNRSVTWFAGISWAGGTAPTLTTTANKTDVFGFLRTGTNTYDGYVVGQNL